MTAFCRQTSAGKLRFLAAHDVGRVGLVLGKARHDADVAALARNARSTG